MASILVIDDAAEMRQAVRRILERAEHIVVEAEDGEVGVLMLEQHHPAVVITDMVMPNMEGIETIQHVRRLLPNTRIIAMSGSAESSAAMYLGAARKLGADAALAKPFSMAALLELVDRLLRAGSAEQASSEMPGVACSMSTAAGVRAGALCGARGLGKQSSGHRVVQAWRGGGDGAAPPDAQIFPSPLEEGQNPISRAVPGLLFDP